MMYTQNLNHEERLLPCTSKLSDCFWYDDVSNYEGHLCFLTGTSIFKIFCSKPPKLP